VRRLLAILLVLTITPSAMELVEWSAHLVSHGDFAHSEDGGHDERGDEHGCTALQHACACHVSALATEARAIAPGVEPAGGAPAEPLAPAGVTSRGAEPPPIRPPIV
jgi:hypothetical protein